MFEHSPFVIHNVTTVILPVIPNILIRLVVTLAKDYCLIYSIKTEFIEKYFPFLAIAL